MSWTLIPAASLRPEPWRNGLGTSRTIASKQGPNGLLWMVGIADLERDAEFSHYPGIDRVFTPIDGGIPLLAFHGGPFEPCPLLVPKPFPGDIPTTSRIPAPGRAFNAMADRTRLSVHVAIHRPSGPLTLPASTLVHCLQGAAILASTPLAPGDTLLGPGDSLPGQSPLAGTASPGTTLITVSFTPT